MSSRFHSSIEQTSHTISTCDNGCILPDVLIALPGILVNKDGVPEEEENFDEAIKAVNSALVPTKVR